MKKKILIIVPVIVLTFTLLFSLIACSSADKDGYDDSYKPNNSTGYYDESESDSALDGESYTEIVENPFVSAETENTSYFSIDANTASYPILRKRIMDGYASISKDSVRVEEMLNYFSYDYVYPRSDDIMAMTCSAFDNPYNSETVLFTIGLASKEVEFQEVKNNLVFLIDVSGSMYSSDKLPLVQQAFSMLTENLNAEDRVSIVTYAGNDKVALKGAYGNEKQKINAVIEDLSAGGSTAGSKGIQTAYQVAEEYFIEGGNNRVILATDGDFNVGLSSNDALKEFISEKRATGIYFSVYGFGTGNLKSDLMETLALNGNGTYSYIDSVKEAQKALVTDIGGSLVTVAKDVKASVTFNTEYIDSYRLIGYENKLLTEDEFNDANTDAGELGSGHTVTVVYEVKLKEVEIPADVSLGAVTLKYKSPVETEGVDPVEQTLSFDVSRAIYHEVMTDQDKFIVSVIEFALILRESEYKGSANLNTLIARLEALDLSGDEFKAEFREVVKKYRENLGY
ncbi:MAG: von Willebrand factor type A domain-containing protein [Clostridia bacterium]|nr:von Willebrand factor type A domain-containing protein [Clostridia bacterium]